MQFLHIAAPLAYGSHYVRDETLSEDRSQSHIGGAPRVMAVLRNGLIALLRHYGASPQRALQLIGRTETRNCPDRLTALPCVR